MYLALKSASLAPSRESLVINNNLIILSQAAAAAQHGHANTAPLSILTISIAVKFVKSPDLSLISR
jgi:hypothetical protein